MRAKGTIRVVHGRIAGIGELDPRAGEERIDASGCVVYPGLISTHHHLFQSVLKGVRAGIDCPLFQWLRLVPYSYWHKIDEEALRVAARIGLVEPCSPAPPRPQITIICSPETIASIPRT